MNTLGSARDDRAIEGKMIMNMLRKAVRHDADDIARIHVNTWRAAYSGIVSDSHLDSLSVEDRTTRWRQHIDKAASHLYVAICDDGVTGWISFGPSRDQDGEGRHEIYAVYVQPRSWGHGIGTSLMSCAEHLLWAEKRADITLWVFENNHSARTFYRHRGYEPDGATQDGQIGGAERG
jgi:GNAT superfamily N-acetyltransferase